MQRLSWMNRIEKPHLFELSRRRVPRSRLCSKFGFNTIEIFAFVRRRFLMRLSLVFLMVVAFALIVGLAPWGTGAQEEDDVRGAFLTSRSKDKPQPQNSTDSTKRPPRKRPQPGPSPGRVGPVSGTG